MTSNPQPNLEDDGIVKGWLRAANNFKFLADNTTDKQMQQDLLAERENCLDKVRNRCKLFNYDVTDQELQQWLDRAGL